jgi:peptidoglycan/xylan/chitin deacetylase (PgdA/CDA1 family)
VRYARWVITFDDGPLPTDLYEIDRANPAAALDPLAQVLDVLATYPAGRVPATFYVRGPAYPWRTPPPTWLFRDGLRMIRRADARHEIGLHCLRHDPALWFYWWLHPWQRIMRDLDGALAFFGALPGAEPMVRFRPPYGRGGPGGRIWARRNGYAYHLWDLDSEDWLHHLGPNLLRMRAYQQDVQAEQHRLYISDRLRRWLPRIISDRQAREILFHVSRRTAGYLSSLLDVIVDVSRRCGYEPLFVPAARAPAPGWPPANKQRSSAASAAEERSCWSHDKEVSSGITAACGTTPRPGTGGENCRAPASGILSA